MTDMHAQLKELNRQTFDAEAKIRIGELEWDAFLRQVLAPAFIIRRSKAEVADQDRDQMIAWIKERTTPEREPLEVVSWCSDTLGVVRCAVKMHDDAGKLRKYQNVKIFSKTTDGPWLCIYWQVTEAPV